MYSPRRRESSIDNGLIYPVVVICIKLLFYLNVVELVKKLTEFLTVKYYRNKSLATQKIKIRRNRNFAIDLFIVLKFIFLVVIICMDVSSVLVKTTVWYLLISNVFTYFYYHLWCDDVILGRYQNIHRVRRRFINFFVSFIFMVLCYSYLYITMIPEHFTLVNEGSDKIGISILSSIGNSFAIDVDYLKNNSDHSKLIEMSQTLNTFLFLTILLSTSLPKAKQE